MSSIRNGQVGPGFILTVPPLITRIFILPSGKAGDLLCQRDERRFKTGLVTRRRIHVTKLRVRRHDTAAGADGNERAVAALIPWSQLLEPSTVALPPGLDAAINVAYGLCTLPGEARAPVQRP